MWRLKILFLLALLIPACGSSPRPTNAPSAPANIPSASHAVTYQIEAASAKKVKITYQTADGSTQQEEVPTKWSKTLQVASGSFVYISAQIQTGGGRVSCIINIDGKPFKQAQSEGAFVIASCSGSVPK